MDDIFNSFIVNKLFTHRGLYNNEKGIPENCLISFEKAKKKGYAIELDILGLEQFTPVVFHDLKLSRMTGKDGYINNLIKEDLVNYPLINSNELIPTLEEALNFIDGRTPIIIEIKNRFRPGVLEKKVLELLKNYKGEFAIASFNPYSLGWFKNNAPNIWRGQISSFFDDKKLSPLRKLFLKRLKLTRVSSPHFISYDAKNLPNIFVNKFKKLPLLSWPIKSQEEYLKVIKHCDNVIFEGFEPKL